MKLRNPINIKMKTWVMVDDSNIVQPLDCASKKGYQVKSNPCLYLIGGYTLMFPFNHNDETYECECNGQKADVLKSEYRWEITPSFGKKASYRDLTHLELESLVKFIPENFKISLIDYGYDVFKPHYIFSKMLRQKKLKKLKKIKN